MSCQGHLDKCSSLERNRAKSGSFNWCWKSISSGTDAGTSAAVVVIVVVVAAAVVVVVVVVVIAVVVIVEGCDVVGLTIPLTTLNSTSSWLID